MTTVTDGIHTYNWIEDWAKTPESSSANGRTHGVAEAANGSVYVFHQAKPAVLVFNQEGHLTRSFSNDFEGAHGLTLVQEDGAEYLWLTDEVTGRVAKVTLDGNTVQTIQRANHAAYGTAKYSPTWVAVNPQSHEIWVTDGYGASLVHMYTPGGEYVTTIDGTEPGASGRFSCPHAIWFNTRSRSPELYIADRANRRIQVYSGDGSFLRSFGEDDLIFPCAFAEHDGFLFVPELFGRTAVFDAADTLVGYLGQNDAVATREWPGGVLDGWPDVPKRNITPGRFNSPHGVCTGADGSVFLVEWILGGRVIRLSPV